MRRRHLSDTSVAESVLPDCRPTGGGAGPKPGSPDGRRIPTAMEALSPRATGGARRTPAYRPAKPLLQPHRLRIPLYGVAGDTRLKATCSGTPAGIRSAPRDDHFDGRPYPAEAMRPGPTPFYACSWRSSRCTACCCCAAGSGHACCAVCSGACMKVCGNRCE